MRKPSEYIKNAVANLANALPQVLMRCGVERGNVYQVSGREGAGQLSEESPDEAVRYLAAASDFPSMRVGNIINVDGADRIVTSFKPDLVGASMTIGASNTFNDVVEIYGESLRGTAKCISQQVGFSDSVVSEFSVESNIEEIRIFVPRLYWSFSAPPKIGDTIFDRKLSFRGRITRISLWSGTCYALTCEEA